MAPLTVTFQSESTGVIDNQQWQFGDGADDSALQPDHTYSAPGSYSVTLTVEGPGGVDQITIIDAITVEPALPGFHRSRRQNPRR